MERRESGVKMFCRHFYSEGFPLILALTLQAPIERYQIISQTRGLSKFPEIYRSLSNYISSVPSREGVLGYWRGNVSSISRYFYGSILKFKTYHYFREKVIGETKPEGSELMVKEGIAVLLSMSVSQIIAYPFELARTRVACDFSLKGELRNYSGAYDAIKKTARDFGVKGCYDGLLLSIGTCIPHLALSVNLFESVKNDCKNQNEIHFAMVFCAFVAQVMVYPFEVLRRRRQVADGNLFKNEPAFVHLQIQNILKHEGVKGFYQGLFVSSFRSIPLIAAQIQGFYWINNRNILE